MGTYAHIFIGGGEMWLLVFDIGHIHSNGCRSYICLQPAYIQTHARV